VADLDFGLSDAARGRAVVAGAGSTILLGLLGFLGWMTPWPWLGSFGPELQPMSPASGVGLVLLGAVLLLDVRWPSPRRSAALALLVFAASLARLAVFVTGLPVLLDPWLARISPLTTVAFLLAAAALASQALRSRRRGVGDLAGLLTALVILLTLVVLLGYAFGTPFLYGGALVPMALPTALAFVCLGAASIAFSGPDHLPFRLLTGPSVEARLLRGLLPIPLAVVVVDCFLFRFDPGLNPALRAAQASLLLAMVVSAGGISLARRVGGVVDTAEAQRRRAEQELRESEEKLRESEERLAASEAVLRQFIKHTPAAVAMFDTEMRYLQASDRWLTDYHLLGQDVVGRSHYEVFPDLPERWKEVHRRVLTGAVERCVEDEFPRADGSTEWLHWEARPWLKPDGSIGGLSMFTQVVTDRKRVGEEHARLSRAIEQSAEAVMITDPAGTIVYVNPAFSQVTGYTREEAVGQNSRLLKSGKQDAAFYRQMWATLLRGEAWTGHITNRRKDGSLFEEDAAISPVRDASGRLVNYVAVKRDITHEKSLEQQLLQAQKMEAVGRLAGGVAHDFNNILGVILGYGETVEHKLPAEDPLRDKVKQILRAGRRAADLTRQLLAFSRKQVLQPRALDLNEVVLGMEKMLRRLIGEDIELATRLEPHLGTVRADPGQIEQVLMNLAVNARDAMSEGGHLKIEIGNADLDQAFTRTHSRVPAGRYVMLSVTDDGVGMSRETEAHIFEPFFTTKDPGKGTGLGLSTVYGIVKQSEGYIWVYSELGHGTTFKIYLPRIDEEVVAESEPAATAVSRGTETVLVVEDESALRDLLRDVLEDNGYTVLAAGGGEEALRAAEAHPGHIDLLLTDVVMPGMTGPRLAQEVLAKRPDLKVVYVSGYSEEAVASLGRLGPGALLVSKPFAAAVLLRALRSALNGKG